MMRTFSIMKVMMTLLFFCNAMILVAQDAYIKGTVTTGNEIVSNATVLLGEETSVTNSKGEFSFQVKAGKYYLIITHVGYERIKVTISIQAGETKFFNYTLIPSGRVGEEVVINSLARVKRSNLNTPVPVTALSSTRLLQTGQPSFVQMLDATVPSINISRQQIWDNISIRGLRPDQALITVDGIRYHARSSVSFRGAHGSLGNGAVNNDLYAIPFSAIEKVEILFDGASAQHGSDAIAGVFDIQLKKSIGKTSIQFNTGQYYPGDGENFNLGINHGIPLNKKNLLVARQGYLNISADLHYRAPTSRGGIYQGTVYYSIPDNATPLQRDLLIALDNQRIIERGFDRRRIPRGRESTKLYSVGYLINGGLPIKNNTEIFWTAVVNYRKPSYLTAYRFPKNKQQVNLEIYPDGFLADVHTPIWDYSLKGGVRGKTHNNWNWTLVSSLGRNTLTNVTHNSNNASQQFLLGKNAQTSFQCGGTSFGQFLNHISFTKRITALKKIKTINIASGAEWRLENYQITPGEEAAWKNYDSTGQKNAGAVSLGNFSESNAVNVNRHVLAFYTDVETEFNDRLLIDKAIRFERYSGYGNNLAGKLAMRYKFSDKLTWRVSVSNSFRAPPLQQAYLGTTGVTGWRTVNGIKVPAARGIFPNNHYVVSTGFGVPKLRPEKAINVSSGITSYFSSRFSATIDAYWIQVKDRIVFSGAFDRKINPAVNNILQPYPNVEVVTFTCNAVNTRTIGGDIVVNSRWDLFKGQLRFTFAANFNRTRIFGIIQSAKNLPDDSVNSNTLFNRGAIGNIEKLQPQSKFILTTSYSRGKWAVTLINRRHGSTEYIDEELSEKDEFFSAKILTDLNIKFNSKTWYTITVGCNNLFNVKPDPLKNYDNTDYGRSVYGSQYLPFGANGGYYFVGMSFNF